MASFDIKVILELDHYHPDHDYPKETQLSKVAAMYI